MNTETNTDEKLYLSHGSTNLLVLQKYPSWGARTQKSIWNYEELVWRGLKVCQGSTRKDLSVNWYSQLLPKPPDLGLGVGELHTQVLPALGALHAGGATRGLRCWRMRQETETVPLLRQLDDGLWSQSTGKSPEWHSQSHLWVRHS